MGNYHLHLYICICIHTSTCIHIVPEAESLCIAHFAEVTSGCFMQNGSFWPRLVVHKHEAHGCNLSEMSYTQRLRLRHYMDTGTRMYTYIYIRMYI